VRVPTIVLTGPVGVGKTTVASDVSWLAEAAGIPHGGVDLDGLGWMHPHPPAHLAWENLATVWASYAVAGATHLVLALTATSRGDLTPGRDAVPGWDPVVFRLRASRATLRARVARREGAGPGFEIHREQSERLYSEFEASGVADHVIETDERAPSEVARVVFELSGWLD
jgi:hypothetical protein